MGGSDGTSAPQVETKTAAQIAQDRQARTQADPRVAKLLAQYGSGGLSLQDALAQAGTYGTNTAASRTKGSQADIETAKQKLAAAQKGQNDYQSLLARARAGDAKAAEEWTALDKSSYQGQSFARDIDTYNGQIKDLSQQIVDPDNSLDLQTIQNLVATDPMAARKFSTDQVMSDPVFQKMYGAGGQQDKLFQDADKNRADIVGADQQVADSDALINKLNGYMDENRQALSGKDDAYKLQDSDYAAYGEGSGNIARMFGQQEQGLAQALADRGLASSPNGVAASQFSGLYGNKMEQLGQLQRQISQDRVNKASEMFKFRTQADQERLSAQQGYGSNLRNYGMGLRQYGTNLNDQQRDLTALYDKSINDNRTQNLAGRAINDKTTNDAAQMQLAQAIEAQNQSNEAFNQRLATAKPSAWGNIATAAIGAGAGALTGGLGAGIGMNLADSLISPSPGRTQTNQSAAKTPQPLYPTPKI